MFKTTVADNIEFAYHDSGAPASGKEYTTMIVIHGHTYHSGTFVKFSQEATANGYRIILPNRRLYPGSTTLTDEESQILISGPFEKREKLIDGLGEQLALFVDNMIQEHKLTKVAVVAWSIAAGLLNVLIESITRLTKEQQARLREHVISFVHWDPPCSAFGLDYPSTGGWIPLYDMNLPPEQRGPAFGQWVVTYFPHPNLASRDPTELLWRAPENAKTPTFTGLPFDQLLAMVDLTSGDKGDTTLGGSEFQRDAANRMRKALFDPDVREAWANAKFWCICGDQSPWNVVWGVWCLEDLVKGNDKFKIGFKLIEGGNHFTMYDLPEASMATIGACING